MTTPTVDSAFDLYANALDPRERQRAFTELVTLKALPKYVNDPRFEMGLDAWSSLITSSTSSDEYRLLAVAELVRAGQVAKVKQWTARIAESITPAFTQELPPSRILKEADERLNIARACSASSQPWLPKYLAQSIADEDTGEKARGEFLSVLIARTNSLKEAFALLGEAFATIRFDTEMPSDSMAKRLSRTLAAMRPVLLLSLAEAGASAGKSFEEWLRLSMRASGKPKEEKVAIDLAREVALTTHDLVRTRFSMATEPETYLALKLCRNFFTENTWPVELRKAMDLLVKDVSEAILLLGRQDVPQQELLDQLVIVCAHKDRAKVVAKSLADKNQDLPERIRDWLRRGRMVTTQTTSVVLQETLLDANDASVGLALLEATKLSGFEDVMQRMLGTIDIFEPDLGYAAREYAESARKTISGIKEIAKRRGIELYGSSGEQVAISPKYFDLLTSVRTSTATVTRPAIVRKVGGTEFVIIKGLVK